MIQKGQGFGVVRDDRGAIVGLLNADHIPALIRNENLQNVMQKNILKVTVQDRAQDVIEKMRKASHHVALVYDQGIDVVQGFWQHKP